MLKRRSFTIALTTAIAGLVLSAAPATAAPDPLEALHAAGIDTYPLIEMTTPQGKGYFYTASSLEASRAETVNKFKRTGTELGEIAAKPFEGGAALYRLRMPGAGTYIVTASTRERDTLVGSGKFVLEGVVGYIGTSGDPAKRIWRFHLDNQSKWRITTDKQSMLKSGNGWSLDGPVGYLG
jgi:hypothetical protein